MLFIIALFSIIANVAICYFLIPLRKIKNSTMQFPHVLSLSAVSLSVVLIFIVFAIFFHFHIVMYAILHFEPTDAYKSIHGCQMHIPITLHYFENWKKEILQLVSASANLYFKSIQKHLLEKLSAKRYTTPCRSSFVVSIAEVLQC